MFDGGDIIGIGDTADEINPDKTTSTVETISRNSTYGAFPTDDTHEYPPPVKSYLGNVAREMNKLNKTKNK